MKNRKRRIILPLEGACFLVLLLGLACSHPPARLQVHPRKLSFHNKGRSKKLNVTVLDKKGNVLPKVKPKYTSSDTGVARVDAGGRVTAEGSGKAVITIRAGKATADVDVSVKIIKTLKLSLPKAGEKELSGPANTVVPLTVTALDDKDRPIKKSGIQFQSNNKAVATVDDKGHLTLLGSGTVTVAAKADGKSSELTIPVSIWSPLAVKLDQRSVSLRPGDSYTIRYTVISKEGLPIPFPAAFNSSNAKVAGVTDQGVVQAHSRGEATITIKAGKVFNTLSVSVR